jgi:5-(carboxyamino)imidazole ribonucleotide synthase
MSARHPLPHGAVIGVLGTGQLGRMFTDAAHALGYQVAILGPDADRSPAGQVADLAITAPYTDTNALDELARVARVVTVEFENIPRSALDHLAARVPAKPEPRVLHICQHRLREKSWLRSNGFPHAEFVPVASRAELDDALAVTGTPAVLKTAAFGYDGKGQVKLERDSDLDAAWASLGTGPASVDDDGLPEAAGIVEAFVPFVKEVSVVVARNGHGETRAFPVCENEHHRHVLAVTRIPGDLPTDVAARAQAYATQIAQALRVEGLLTVEFFVTADHELIVNELAPRPHNSGHPTIDCCASSQFAHHVRAITGQPLPPVKQTAPALMANILGDLWFRPDGSTAEPDWNALRSLPGAHLHLYGKSQPALRRKMGHLTVIGDLAPDVEACIRTLGIEQRFEAPRPPTPFDQLRARLAADPFTAFDLVLTNGTRLRVDQPAAIAPLRDRWMHQSPDGTLTPFSPADVAEVGP